MHLKLGCGFTATRLIKCTSLKSGILLAFLQKKMNEIDFLGRLEYKNFANE